MVNRRKTAAEIRSIRESGRMLATVLQLLRTSLEPGITTAELDRLAAEELQKLGGEPAFLGYGGFPAVLCTSVNDEAQHGIPGSRVLELGDIVNLDFGVRYQGMVTDGGITVGVGEVNSDVQKLITTDLQ
jgi:methionyl aminopeptidase